MRHPGIMLLNPESNVLGEANVTPPFRILKDVYAISCRHSAENWLRGLDLNQRPSGYEPDELPGCSTPRLHYGDTDREINPKMLFATTISPIRNFGSSGRIRTYDQSVNPDFVGTLPLSYHSISGNVLE